MYSKGTYPLVMWSRPQLEQMGLNVKIILLLPSLNIEDMGSFITSKRNIDDFEEWCSHIAHQPYI